MFEKFTAEHLLHGLMHQNKWFLAQLLPEQGFNPVQIRSRWAPLNLSDFKQGTNYV
jgi:Clp amino terminal domain, pathogenicity island component